MHARVASAMRPVLHALTTGAYLSLVRGTGSNDASSRWFESIRAHWGFAGAIRWAPATFARIVQVLGRTPTLTKSEVAGSSPASRANDKLYIVVRADLYRGMKLPQACHAMRAFADEHPELELAWFRSSNTIVVLEVPDQVALEALQRRSVAKGLRTSVFREPDLGGAATALALEPAASSMLSSLPLAR